MNSFTATTKNPTLADLGSQLGFAREWVKNQEYKLQREGYNSQQIWWALKKAYLRLDELSQAYGEMKGNLE